MIVSLSLVLVAGVAVCAGLMPTMMRLARRVDLVDRPDARRKMHKRVTPLAGGLSVFVAVTAVCAAFVAFAPIDLDGWNGKPLALPGLLIGAAAILALGVIDDLGKLRGKAKLLGQVAVSALVVASGLRIEQFEIFGQEFRLGTLAIPFTICFLVGVINSLNLLDGMDGLLGSVGLFVSLTLGVLAALSGQWLGAAVALSLAGALIGFLRYNLPPASVFLGDSGSMLVGLLIGVTAIECSLKGPATVTLVAPLALLTLPIFDTSAAILRRKLTGRSIYDTDRGHFHHCLLRRGMSAWAVLGVVTVCSLVTATGVIAGRAFHNDTVILLTCLSVVGTLTVTGLFGYAEATLLKQRLLSLVRSVFKAGGTPAQMRVRLQGTLEWQGLWESLVAKAPPMGIHTLKLDVNAPSLHEGYHARWAAEDNRAEGAYAWRAEIPFIANEIEVGVLSVAGNRGPEPVWRKVAALSQILDDFAEAMFSPAPAVVSGPSLAGEASRKDGLAPAQA